LTEAAKEVKKIQRYIDNTPLVSERYSVSFVDMVALAESMDGVDAVALAFQYGRAKGYRAAKAEGRT